MASALKLNFATAAVWKDTGTSGATETLTLQNLANGVGRNGDIHDWGAAPRSGWYQVEAGGTGWETAPIVGELLKVYIRKGGLTGGTNLGNDDGATDVGLSSADKLLNLEPVLIVKADEAVADIPTFARAEFFCSDRYFGITVINLSAGDNLQNTQDSWTVTVTPFHFEAQ